MTSQFDSAMMVSYLSSIFSFRLMITVPKLETIFQCAKRSVSLIPTAKERITQEMTSPIYYLALIFSLRSIEISSLSLSLTIKRLFKCKELAWISVFELKNGGFRDLDLKRSLVKTRPSKVTSLGQNALFKPSCVKIGLLVWSEGPYSKKDKER